MKMNKQMLIMLLVLLVLFGGIFGYKMFGTYMMKRYFATQKAPIVSVTAMSVDYVHWELQQKAVGSVRAVLGVNITTESAGMIKNIYFKPGSIVKKNQVLVQLNADAEIAALRALEAQAKIAAITYHRDQAQYAIRAISKQNLENDLYQLKSLEAQVAQQKATVEKKKIRAPFNGRLGISAVNPGQYLNVGDKITTLQTSNPVYVDFYLPQQKLAHISVGQTVHVQSDAFPGKIFPGKISTIDPLVEKNTRNVQIEATVANPHGELSPGMFAAVEINSGKKESFLTLPQTAISFNPYGNVVYVLHEQGKDDQGQAMLIAKQVFVSTGETRGDQVAILEGLKAKDQVVTSGQLKLKNGSRVLINNSVIPSNNPQPEVENG